MSDRLFTPRFFIMCAYSFTVFVSVFQLLPTAPYHIIDLGGSFAAAGLFHGVLTYSSALSAPITGAVGDRLGQRRVLMTVSLVLAGFSASYAFIRNIPLLLGVVFFHGLFWSALLSASGAYMTATIPVARRAEGISYWGLTSALAVAVAPATGFWIYHHGWDALCLVLVVLNLTMAIIAWRLPDDRASESSLINARGAPPPRARPAALEDSLSSGGSSINARGVPPPRARPAALEDSLSSGGSSINARGAPPPRARSAALEDSLSSGGSSIDARGAPPPRARPAALEDSLSSGGSSINARGVSPPRARPVALEDSLSSGGSSINARGAPPPRARSAALIEWRVLGLSVTMSLVSFGYGALTSFSAMFADESHIEPRSLFLTTAAIAIVVGRLTVGRTLDEVGYRRVLLPCLAVPAIGLALLAVSRGRLMFALSALVFGSGFGLMYPAYTSYIMRHVLFSRRGAAFGAMLAAFDTGIGTGSSVVGWLIHRMGFRVAYGIAAGVAALALPYFLVAEKKLGFEE